MSGRRVTRVKASVVALCVALPLTAVATLARVPVYRALMEYGGPATRLDAAVHLVSDENDEKASLVLAGMLRQDPDAHRAERIFEAYEAADRVPELGAAEYQTLLASDAEVRQIVLGYLARGGDAYDWLTLDRVLAWEPLVLERRKPADEEEGACSDDCEALAGLVVDRFLEHLDWSHFEAYLSSANPVRAEYALLVVEGSDEPVLTEALIELVADPTYGERATDVLMEWSGQVAEQEAESVVEEVEAELSPARAKKLQAYFRERLEKPKLGREQ